ncbi:hypothetical protein Hypma_005152 [Hypsizygus marmoreus]|uniref:Uncharacterized protein n=1 Tax=Hypsizygus marmoreus TaxID=39966 RepID=A0A369K084_HYPMA|nr:hypothetical protein Hypma_005152 [Hypsizygus marmoreus]
MGQSRLSTLSIRQNSGHPHLPATYPYQQLQGNTHPASNPTVPFSAIAESTILSAIISAPGAPSHFKVSGCLLPVERPSLPACSYSFNSSTTSPPSTPPFVSWHRSARSLMEPHARDRDV